MRSPRTFRPSAPVAMEDRVMLSMMGARGLAGRPVTLPAAEVSRSNESEASFPMDATDTLRAGQVVSEQLTTTYNDGTSQTTTLVRVPNLSADSITASKTIHLRNDGGTEAVVDTETFSGGSTPLAGNLVRHTITTTFPDGATQTEAETVQIRRHTSKIHATITEANGRVETISGTDVHRKHKIFSDRTIVEPNGTIEHQVTLTTDRGDLDSTSQSTTTQPGEIQWSSSATQVTRLAPPSS